MIIRTASLEDLDAMTKIEQVCFPAAEAADRASFCERLTYYPNHFWLLTDQEKIVGFVNEGVSESVHGNVIWYQMRLTF